MIKRFESSSYLFVKSRNIDFVIKLILINILVFAMIKFGIFDIININKSYYKQINDQSFILYILFTSIYFIYNLWINGLRILDIVEIDYENRMISFDYRYMLIINRKLIRNFDKIRVKGSINRLDFIIDSNSYKIHLISNKNGWKDELIDDLKNELGKMKIYKNIGA